jgi:hypothetical protein
VKSYSICFLSPYSAFGPLPLALFFDPFTL